jgi:hypothetical protein
MPKNSARGTSVIMVAVPYIGIIFPMRKKLLNPLKLFQIDIKTKNELKLACTVCV